MAKSTVEVTIRGLKKNQPRGVLDATEALRVEAQREFPIKSEVVYMGTLYVVQGFDNVGPQVLIADPRKDIDESIIVDAVFLRHVVVPQAAPAPVVKPPLGLVPLHVIRSNRIAEILAAMDRYRFGCKPIPEEWVEELTEHVDEDREFLANLDVTT